MHLRRSFAFPFAALVLVAWFLWPFESIAQDPPGAVLAAARAVALFAVTLGATNFAADHVPDKHSQLLRVALGFTVAWTITASISIALDLIGLLARPRLWQPLLVSVTFDAFWCAAALWLYNLLTGGVPSKTSAD
jgi:hypothetical protein